METKEQYMVTPVMDFAETVKMVEKMKKNAEANVALANQLKANIVALQKSTAHDLVVHNGKVLVKVERKAREGDFVVFEGLNRPDSTKSDKFYEVLSDLEYKDDTGTILRVYGWGTTYHNLKVFEVIGNIPQSNLVVEAFEPIPIENGTKPPCKHLTANQKRARAIQMAKDFVEYQKTCHTGIAAKGNRHEGKIRTYKGIYKRTQGNIVYLSNAEFIRKGNRVTCLLKGVETNKVRFVGRAECHVDDVFNEHIGQAVALAKALDIVEQLPPDILKAVQPSRRIEGMIVEFRGNRRMIAFEYIENETCHFDSETARYGEIIDDTNAQYETIKGGEK